MLYLYFNRVNLHKFIRNQAVDIVVLIIAFHLNKSINSQKISHFLYLT